MTKVKIKYGKGLPDNKVSNTYSVYVDILTDVMYKRSGNVWVEVQSKLV